MTDSLSNLQRKIGSASDLKSVVRTMKAMAAASITQYENAVRALDDYYQTVQSGLQIGLRDAAAMPAWSEPRADARVCAVIFGSDQGLIGQFNDVMLDFASAQLNQLALAGKPAGAAASPAVPDSAGGGKIVHTARIWAVGERIQSGLEGRYDRPPKVFRLPASIKAISPFVTQLLTEIEAGLSSGDIASVYLFFNRPDQANAYQPHMQRLLPLDQQWLAPFRKQVWQSACRPELLGDAAASLRALLAEYLFVSLFRACAESLASENACRLSAMQRAEKNIDEMLGDLHQRFQQTRQQGIDEELSDLIAGFEALNKPRAKQLADA